MCIEKKKTTTYQVQFVSGIAQRGPTQGCEGSPQAMARQDQLVARVGLHGRLELGCDIGSNGLPRRQEARMRFTAITQITGIGQVIVQVGDPVAGSAAAPEGDHDQFVRLVDGHEAGNVAKFRGAEALVFCSRSAR